MLIPQSVDDAKFHLSQFGELFMENLPSNITWLAYLGFFVAQIFFAMIVPGKIMYGFETEDGTRLKYNCNGYWCYYLCLIGLFLVDFTKRSQGYFFSGIGLEITDFADHYGQYLIASTIIGDLTSVYWYLYGLSVVQPGASKNSGNVMYDFFMGTVLYPRIGDVDIKVRFFAFPFYIKICYLLCVFFFAPCSFSVFKKYI